jgi:flagellin-like hook-associated protein FlgL
VSGTAGAGEFNIQDDTSLSTMQDTLTAALGSLRSFSSTLGSNLAVVQTRQDFAKGMIDTLKTGADNLVLADPNEEGASLLALNTRTQLSQTALSLASQADQAVLRLF